MYATIAAKEKRNAPEHGELGKIRAALEDLDPEGWTDAPDAVIEEDFAELHRIGELAEAAMLRLLPEIERRGIFSVDGHLSVVSWFASKFKLAYSSARRKVGLARALEHMPETRTALEEGTISLSGANVLASARQVGPRDFDAAEPQLVQAARMHSVPDLQRATTYWTQAVEAAHPPEVGHERYARRRLHASPTLAGMVRVDADLDPECGETLLTALRAVTDTEARSGEADDRTPAQRRADALGEICRGWLDLAPRPSVAGERPHVTVTVAAEVLARGVPEETDALPAPDAPSSRTCELDHTGAIDPEVARRLTCDGSLMRVVMNAGSEPLDIGRRTPVVPPAIRRAVVTRDRHCRFPGCDRPHTWCDAHHVTHWADGGRTAVANLLLLCRRHHRMVHERDGFHLELVDGQAVFRRPDGSALESGTPQDRGPP